MNPSGGQGGSAAGWSSARTLQDILKELQTARQASRGSWAGRPLALAESAAAQGHDPYRAYLYQRRMDDAAEAARQRAAALQARLEASGANDPRRQEARSATVDASMERQQAAAAEGKRRADTERSAWAGPTGAATAGAQVRQGAGQSLADLQKQVTQARANLDFLKTPEGQSTLKERRALEGELRKLGAETARASEAPKSFAEQLGKGGAGLAAFAREGLGAASAAMSYFRDMVSAASPTAMKTFDDSLQLMSGVVGTQVLPVMWRLSAAMQDWTKWLKANLPTPGSEQDDPRKAGFWGNVTGFMRDTVENAIEHPFLTATTLGTYPAMAAAGGRVARAMGSPFAEWAQGAGLIQPPRTPEGMSFVPPGGGPIASYMSGEQYSQGLNIAGLAVGGPEDPQTKLLELQLENMRDTKGLIEKVKQNTDALKDVTGPWR
jgi:hypothetical protein